MNKQLKGYEGKIKLLEDKNEDVSFSNNNNQKFKQFEYSPNENQSVKVLVREDLTKPDMVSDLKWSIKNYDNLAPSYKLELKKIIMPGGYNGEAFGYFTPDKPDTIHVFRRVLRYSDLSSSTFIHEATHVMDWNGITYGISNGGFKNVFYKHAKEELSENLYNKFKNVTENRVGYDSLNFFEKRKIKKLFSSDYGYDSWKRFLNDPTYSAKAFTEELAESVGAKITGKMEDRTVNEKIVKYIMDNLWI